MANVKFIALLVTIAAIAGSLSVVDALKCKCGKCSEVSKDCGMDKDATLCYKAKTKTGFIAEGCFSNELQETKDLLEKSMIKVEAGMCHVLPMDQGEFCFCSGDLCTPPDFGTGSAVLLRSWSWIPLSIFASAAIFVPTFVGGQ